MKKVAIKNRVMFFGGTAIVGVIAIFVSIIILALAFAAPQAHAYAVGSTAPTGSYDFGSSLQNLVSPFTNFFTSLKLNNGTTINTNGTPGAISWPVVNFTPVVAGTIQNVLSQWLNDFDNWFYKTTGVQLSGILVALLNLFSWTLGLAQQAVNWLLGLFH